MTFLAPLTALFATALTVPLLVSLYFLKLRRKPMAVPSTLLWRKSVQDLQVNAPWQRIRNNLLLWLQLLILALLLIAMARPTQPAVADPGSRVVIVIDRSASMNTLDMNGESRLQAAKDAAIRLVDSLDLTAGRGDATAPAGGGAGGVMIVTFAQRATVVEAFTQDRARLRAAIRNINPSDERSRLGPAVALITPLAAALPAGDTADAAGLSAYVFSDGRLTPDRQEELGLPGAEVLYESIGQIDTPNLGIVSCSARRDDQRPDQVSVFARLINAGPSAVSTTVTLKRGGRAVQTQAVTIPPASTDGVGSAAVTFTLIEAGGAELEVTHDRPDQFTADDAARLQLLPARRLSVLLITKGNPYLRVR